MSLKKAPEFTHIEPIEIASENVLFNELSELSNIVNYLHGRMTAAKKPDETVLRVLEKGQETINVLRKYLTNQNKAISRLLMDLKEVQQPEPLQKPVNSDTIKPNVQFWNEPENDLF